MAPLCWCLMQPLRQSTILKRKAAHQSPSKAKHRMCSGHNGSGSPKSFRDFLIGARNYQGAIRKTPGRLLGLVFIRLYQFTFSAIIGHSCRHMPTCSEYGFESIVRHGLWAGGWMTFSRVLKCRPGGTSGYDPVQEKLMERQVWWAPWRYFTHQKTG